LGKNLTEVFESFGEARRQGFIHIKSLKEQGRGIVGVFCSRVPVELFSAAGLVAVSLCPAGGEAADQTPRTLPGGLCPLVRASLDAALGGACPYIYFSDLVVGETSCDGKIGMYRRLGKLKDVHVMELPRTPADSRWPGEIMALRKKIEEKFQVKISGEKLREAIRRRNRERRLLKQLYELSRANPPPVTGLQQLQILYGAQFRFDHEEKVRELEETIGRIKEEYAAGERVVPEGAARILLTGCPGPVKAMEKIVRLIEESGAVVVVYETCAGARQYDRQVSETGNPYHALGDYCLGTACTAGPGPGGRELLERLRVQFAVDGIIEMTLGCCHQTETRDLAKSAGNLPFMSLEIDYSGGAARLEDRITAFIKTLRRGGGLCREVSCS
jgi:benzoyl-CoA reductase/2-hydroxyglutaryl-CoA dehydratase subunit BcrC/BadD/HgdB